MMKFCTFVGILTMTLLAACANVPEAAAPEPVPAATDKITRAEAKRLACPSRIIEVGASPEDCACVENHLFDIGQKPGAIKYNSISPALRTEIENDQGKRDIAIGILRLDAFEFCGLLDPEHPVARNLQTPST